MSIHPTYDQPEQLKQIALGDRDAFTRLFDQYQRSVFSVALSLSHSRETANDIVQDVFLKIWLRREELPAIDNFHGFLVVLTRRVLIDEFRRQSRERMHAVKATEVVPAQSGENPENLLQEKQYAALVEKGIAQLPEQQARVFRLIKQQGHSRAEAAGQLDLSEETVKKHLERAMRFIRAYLLEHMDDALLWVLIFSAL